MQHLSHSGNDFVFSLSYKGEISISHTLKSYCYNDITLLIAGYFI